MKAIKTTYHGPTNTKGTRIIASDGDGNQITISRDCAREIVEDHRRAAEALCDKMGWKGKLIGGSLASCMVWVFLDPADITPRDMESGPKQ